MTVVLEKVEIRLTVEQILAAIRQLPPEDIVLVRKALEMESDALREKFMQVVMEIRAGVAADPNPITDEEITEEVEIVRARRYAQGRH